MKLCGITTARDPSPTISMIKFLIHSHFVCWQDSAALDCVAIILAFSLLKLKLDMYTYMSCRHILMIDTNSYSSIL